MNSIIRTTVSGIAALLVALALPASAATRADYEASKDRPWP